MIIIVDYGMGNLGSIKNMLLRLGVESEISSSPEDLARADKLILPGVGAFDMAMKNLDERGLIPALNHQVLERKVPILGICLGMQLFSKDSEEGVLPGLGWIDAHTVAFKFEDGPALRVPHMGWNTACTTQDHVIFQDMYEDARFYFVHSFHVKCSHPENVLATTQYGKAFHSCVVRENIVGTQFHPEKSHKFGLKLLDNFARLA